MTHDLTAERAALFRAAVEALGTALGNGAPAQHPRSARGLVFVFADK